MSNAKKILVAWLAVGFYGFGLYAMLTFDKPPEVGGQDIPHFDKLVHAILFGFLGWLCAWGLSAWRADWGKRLLPLLVAATLASGFGVLCELAQQAIPSRSFELADIVANSVGALGAVALFRKRTLYLERTAGETA